VPGPDELEQFITIDGGFGCDLSCHPAQHIAWIGDTGIFSLRKRDASGCGAMTAVYHRSMLTNSPNSPGSLVLLSAR